MDTNIWFNGISIHALREEGDLGKTANGKDRDPFLSTPSARRATRNMKQTATSGTIFLSTPSARRATSYVQLEKTVEYISIHALREEGDLLPTLPAFHWKISIHALREEGDWNASKTLAAKAAFLSTPSARRATMEVAQNGKQE